MCYLPTLPGEMNSNYSWDLHCSVHPAKHFQLRLFTLVMKMNLPQAGMAVEKHLATLSTAAPAEGQNSLPMVARAVGGLTWLLGSP